MYNKRQLIGNAAASLISALISALVIFYLYRYLVFYLGIEQLGLWSVVVASTSVARLSELGFTGSVVKFVAKYRARNDFVQAAEVVQTAAISIALLMVVIILAVYPFLDNLLLLAIPVKSMPEAISLLPWTVLSLWFATIAGVFQGGLDGCQRMDIRSILLIIGNVLFVCSALWLVPLYGLIGLAISQAMQGFFMILVNWVMLRRELISLPWLPVHWTKTIFKEMFSYAVNFQVSSIANMLFEPLVKLLMSRFGGLSSAALYEIASQLVIRLRALIIAVIGALTPAVADLHESAPEKNRDLYIKIYSILFFGIIPFYSAILISFPAVSVLLLGQVESQFLLFGLFLIVGWGLNTLAAPAYFFNLGTGTLNWNTISAVSTAIVNVILGLYLGEKYGAPGVIIGSMFSLIVGSSIIIFFFYKQYEISLWDIAPKDHLILIPAAIFGIAFSAWAYQSDYFFDNIFISGGVSLGMYLLLNIPVMWTHSYKNILFKFIRKYVSKAT